MLCLEEFERKQLLTKRYSLYSKTSFYQVQGAGNDWFPIQIAGKEGIWQTDSIPEAFLFTPLRTEFRDNRGHAVYEGAA